MRVVVAKRAASGGIWGLLRWRGADVHGAGWEEKWNPLHKMRANSCLRQETRALLPVVTQRQRAAIFNIVSDWSKDVEGLIWVYQAETLLGKEDTKKGAINKKKCPGKAVSVREVKLDTKALDPAIGVI